MEREIIRKYGRFEVHFNRRLLNQGLFLAFLGLLGPLLLPQRAMGIYGDLSAALVQNSTGPLLTAAAKLVFMNVCRMTPHYMGAFLVNDAVHVYHGGKRRPLFNIVFTYAMILGIYQLIYLLYHVRYDFGIPAFLTVAFVLVLSYLDLFSVSMWNKVILVFTLLMSIQCLDIVPGLTSRGFGRGEVSMDVKEASVLMHEVPALRMFALSIAAVFFLAVVIQVQLLIKEHVVKVTEEQNRKMEKELYNTQLEALRMRNASEVQSLVHDLKSPLTTVQGLVSLADMMEENPRIREYFSRISGALENMSSMISEILYENRKDIFATEELIHAAMAQVSIRIPAENLMAETACPEALILGNKIRLTRALINLINNAWSAVDHEEGHIELRVSAEGEQIRFEVTDNGKGIAREDLDRIWDLGYSGRGSTGLGLAFTRQVVENHGGSVEVSSELNRGTTAVILLPQYSRKTGPETAAETETETAAETEGREDEHGGEEEDSRN
ncbi:MAG: HAMP domain-containing histidine kinase [Clostridium sp.]|jgi:signal transduction histidine kinase|nr:HAMP domain-containing histidine kinase [Clostridium sp.]MBP3216730.1 HAMP domain-containing histidine kinase [Clostridium sp.]MBQ4149890.1 HAMP domain-containing histidine kinase [Clostridium sp.]